MLLGSKGKIKQQKHKKDCNQQNGRKVYLRDPALAGLNCEQSQHRHEAIVVVKVPPIPFPNVNNWRQIGFNVLKVHSPEKVFLLNVF